jgi:hypothetical protein
LAYRRVVCAHHIVMDFNTLPPQAKVYRRTGIFVASIELRLMWE